MSWLQTPLALCSTGGWQCQQHWWVPFDAAATAQVSPAPPAPLGSCTHNRTLDIPGSGFVPKEFSLPHILEPVEWHQPRMFLHSGMLQIHPIRYWAVSAHLESESLLCFVCPRWLCWIQLVLCWPHLLRKAIT